jgi:hypothetical protein
LGLKHSFWDTLEEFQLLRSIGEGQLKFQESMNMAKIAKQDATAMKNLLASEQKRLKIAGDVADQNGAPEAPQAIEDHEEYTSILKDVLAENDKTSWEPNDITLD